MVVAPCGRLRVERHLPARRPDVRFRRLICPAGTEDRYMKPGPGNNGLHLTGKDSVAWNIVTLPDSFKQERLPPALHFPKKAMNAGTWTTWGERRFLGASWHAAYVGGTGVFRSEPRRHC